MVSEDFKNEVENCAYLFTGNLGILGRSEEMIDIMSDIYGKNIRHPRYEYLLGKLITETCKKRFETVEGTVKSSIDYIKRDLKTMREELGHSGKLNEICLAALE